MPTALAPIIGLYSYLFSLLRVDLRRVRLAESSQTATVQYILIQYILYIFIFMYLQEYSMFHPYGRLASPERRSLELFRESQSPP
jgi:hypothetical protein